MERSWRIVLHWAMIGLPVVVVYTGMARAEAGELVALLGWGPCILQTPSEFANSQTIKEESHC